MKRILILLILSLLFHSLQAQMFTVKENTSYPFWVYLPDGYNDSISSFPLLVFLHGRSNSGTDMNKVLRYGPLYEVNKGLKIPFIIAAPQLPASTSWNPQMVNEVVDAVMSQYKVDTNRFYITGMSLGGFGAFHYAGKYPQRLAAVAIMGGGGKTEDACGMKDLPIWLFHGKLDKPVPFSEATKMLKAIEDCGGYYINLNEYPGWGHKEVVRCFAMPELYEWMSRQDKSKR